MLVSALLTTLTLAVLQLGLALYVRNVVHDAAVEGAHYAALADTRLDEGRLRTREVIERAVGAGFARDVSVGEARIHGRDVVVVRVRTALPVIGLIGVPAGMEVEAHAPMEHLGEG